MCSVKRTSDVIDPYLNWPLGVLFVTIETGSQGLQGLQGSLTHTLEDSRG